MNKIMPTELQMNLQNAVLILGYNNTRINDVKRIRETARNTLNAATILCKKSPTVEDKNTADFVIDVALNSDQKNIDNIMNAIKDISINVVAVLPFSDPGTQLGSKLALHLGLRGPDVNKVNTALDKYAYRQAEKNAQGYPRGYKPIFAEKIDSFEQLCAIHKQLNGKTFLKPTSEGNSRGCMNLSHVHSLENAWSEVRKYISSGVVAEELVSNSEEYSWDHVAGFSWVTEKKTTQNQYRAEIQQIVPAPLSDVETSLITNAGTFMSELAGSNHGACHNEVFYSEKCQSVQAVEPNLRPAGMRIWDLAALAYENFEPWKEWLLWTSQNNRQESFLNTLNQKCYAGLRMITAVKEGILQNIPEINLNTLSTEQVELIEIVWTKKPENSVTTVIKDNSDFIGYIIATSKDYDALSSFLDITTQKLALEVKIYDFFN
ncbi:hypothetical protein [Marivirga sp.]|uniref:ATP-grasp domain-containing protein n=1 Tax=Marivirga sp. TaxID=2018662 RepID=UPI0025DB970A|nr:hypothetical protein [Marivirga sp.]